MINKPGYSTFINTSGESYRVRGLSPLAIEYMREDILKNWNKTHDSDFPEQPTYKVTTVSGETETYYHTEESVQTDEEKLLLKQFKSAQKEFDHLYGNKLLKLCTLCVEVDEDKLKEWEEEQHLIGLEVPQSKAEKRNRYIETRVITSRYDINKLLGAVFAITGLATEEDIRKAEDSFQHKVEGKTTKKSIPDEG